jgi:hypothetical protein
MYKKIYLAIPYSGIQEESFKIANEVSAQLMKEGYIVFSPISHSHSISQQCSLPTNWEFWIEQDEAFIQWCDMMLVVVMDELGHFRISNSVGVQGEIALCKENKKPIKEIYRNLITKKWEII